MAGSFPAALSKKGIDTKVMLPLYEAIGDEWRKDMKLVAEFNVPLAWRNIYCGVYELKHGGVTYYFLDNEYYFKRPTIYGHFDDGERFAYFSRAVIEAIINMELNLDIVHLNDWQTALVPIYIKDLAEQYPELTKIKSVFTIHNIEYQGQFSRQILEDVCGLSDTWYSDGTLEFMDSVSLMKGALITADYVTTVSPTYSEELKYAYYAKGMEGVIASISHKFKGILNGIDMSEYNPQKDPMIYKNYSPKEPQIKAENKAELQRVLGLVPNLNVPIIACVGRLVSHKGMDLILSTLNSIMGLNVQFVVLGTGDYNYEQFFRLAQNHYSQRCSVNITFSEEMARKIYAGADMLLMPSQKEPCGLSQMIAMRYGTIPIVRETGGLKDSVSPYIEGDENSRGFTFENYNASDMLHVIAQAVNLYHDDKSTWDEMVQRDMTLDFSWDKSAAEYQVLYTELTAE